MSDTTLWIVDHIINPVERSLLKVGINSAWKAGLVSAVLTSAIYWTVKPSSAFDSTTGEARPWALLEQPSGSTTEPTLVPWYVGSIIVGYSVNLII